MDFSLELTTHFKNDQNPSKTRKGTFKGRKNVTRWYEGRNSILMTGI